MFESSESKSFVDMHNIIRPIRFKKKDEDRRAIVVIINLVFLNFDKNSSIKILIISSDCIVFNIIFFFIFINLNIYSGRIN